LGFFYIYYMNLNNENDTAMVFTIVSPNFIKIYNALI
jgi:hypothetical protein